CLVNRIQFRAGSVNRYAGFEPTDSNEEPIGWIKPTGFCEHHRQRDVYFEARSQPKKIGRRNPDDRNRSIADSDDFADYRRTLPESAGPVVVADHSHGPIRSTLSHHRIVGWIERATEDGFDSKERKIIPGHVLTLNRFELAVNIDPRIESREGRDSSKRLALFAKLFKTWVWRRTAAAPRTDIVNKKEFLRPLDGQCFYQNCVDQTEDRRVRADAEREGDHCHQSETGLLQQHSRAVAQVLPWLFKPLHAARIPASLLCLLQPAESLA